MRITALLQKIHELASQAEHATAIDIDLMLDYTRVLYSDLLTWRETAAKPSMPEAPVVKPMPVPAKAPEAPTAPAPQSQSAVRTDPPKPSPIPPAAPEKASAPAVADAPAEPTLEEYMAKHAGLPIHRESDPVKNADGEEADSHTPEPPVPLAKVEPPVAAQASKPEPAAPLPVMPAPAAPARDVRSMIGINDKYQIMSELFGNDKAAYEQALDFINRAESEQAAFNWLRERLWVTEDHSDAAMIFFDVVRRFKNA